MSERAETIDPSVELLCLIYAANKNYSTVLILPLSLTPRRLAETYFVERWSIWKPDSRQRTTRTRILWKLENFSQNNYIFDHPLLPAGWEARGGRVEHEPGQRGRGRGRGGQWRERAAGDHRGVTTVWNNATSPHQQHQDRCAGCGHQLRDGQALVALDKQYHIWCFKVETRPSLCGTFIWNNGALSQCTACSVLLHGEYMGHEGRPYCERCYHEKFGVRCTYCHR